METAFQKVFHVIEMFTLVKCQSLKYVYEVLFDKESEWIQPMTWPSRFLDQTMIQYTEAFILFQTLINYDQNMQK